MAAEVERDAAHTEPRWQRWYPGMLLTLWVLIPELRRLVDWQVGFNSLPVINLIPIIALVPLFFIFPRRKNMTFSRDFMLVTCLWLVAFGYSLLVAFLSGGLLSAVYAFALFCLPLLVGMWLGVVRPAVSRRIFARFVSAAIVLGALTSAYGIFQFVAPPAWDVAWVINSGLGSIGQPYPFCLRIFGTMNSPGVLGDFLAVVIVLTVHRLRGRSLWLIVPLLICTAALTLTFDRTAWLETALGLVVYIVLSPRRLPAVGSIGVTVLLTLGLALNLSLITGDPTSNTQLLSRLGTLNDLQNDSSAADREQETSTALREALSEPLGQGLGTVGTATKLSAAGSTTVLDNGYLMRFLEMGVFGVLCFLAAVIGGCVLAFNRLRAAYAARDETAAAFIATSLAIQVAFIGAELSGDHHSALMGIVFWLVIGFASTQAREPRSVTFESLGREPIRSRPAQA
jgi:putative inorganic carbon (HCO3(-)) transporter